MRWKLNVINIQCIVLFMAFILSGSFSLQSVEKVLRVSEEFLTDLLALHQEYCGSTAGLCINDSHREPPAPWQIPKPCCTPCSCLETCAITKNCCPGYLINLRNATRNASNYFMQSALSNPRKQDYNNKGETNSSSDAEYFQMSRSVSQSTLNEVRAANDTINILKGSVKTICVRPQVKYYPNKYLDSQAYEMIGSCPDGDFGSIAQNCEAGLHNEDLNNMGIPVTSVMSGITYVNRHCFECNEADELNNTSFYTWTPMLLSNRYIYAAYVYENPLSLMNNLQYTGSNINIHFIPPAHIVTQPCQSFDVGICNLTGLWEDYYEEIEHLCRFGHILPILQTVNNKRLLFKNIACVQCNIYNENSGKPLSCGFSAFASLPLHTFSILLHGETRNDGSREIINAVDDNDFRTSEPQTLQKCPKGYLNIMDICRKVYCPQDYYIYEGECVPLFGVLSGISLDLKVVITPSQAIDNSIRKKFANRLYYIFAYSLNQSLTLLPRGSGLWFLPRSQQNKEEYFLFRTNLFNRTHGINYSQAVEQIYAFYILIRKQKFFNLNGLRVVLTYDYGKTFGIVRGNMIDKRSGQTLHPLTENALSAKPYFPIMAISNLNWCFRIAFGPNEVYYDEQTSLKINRTDFTLYEGQFHFGVDGRIFLCIDSFTAIQHKKTIAIDKVTITTTGEKKPEEVPWYATKTSSVTWCLIAAIVVGTLLHKIKAAVARRHYQSRTSNINNTA